MRFFFSGRPICGSLVRSPGWISGRPSTRRIPATRFMSNLFTDNAPATMQATSDARPQLRCRWASGRRPQRGDLRIRVGEAAAQCARPAPRWPISGQFGFSGSLFSRCFAALADPAPFDEVPGPGWDLQVSHKPWPSGLANAWRHRPGFARLIAEQATRPIRSPAADLIVRPLKRQSPGRPPPRPQEAMAFVLCPAVPPSCRRGVPGRHGTVGPRRFHSPGGARQNSRHTLRAPAPRNSAPPLGDRR